MTHEDFDKEFSDQLNRIRTPEKTIKSLGLGRKLKNAYSRHKKAIILSTLVTGLSFGVFQIIEDSVYHYGIGVERAAESTIVRRAQQTMSESEKQISDLENTIVELTSSNQELIERIENAQHVDSRRASELLELRREYDNSTRIISDLEKQISMLENNNIDNDSIILEKQSEIDLLTQRLSAYDNLIIQYDAQLLSRDNRILSLEEQIRTYNSQNTSTNDLSSQIEQLNQQIEQSQTQIRNYERQLSEYQSLFTEKNNTISNLEGQVRNLLSSNNNNSELQRQVQELTIQLRDNEQQITSYELEIRRQENEIRTRDSRIISLENELTSFRNVSQNINYLDSQLQQLNHQVDNYERQISDYQREIEDKNSMISSLEEQLQGARTSETINNNLQNHVERLTEEITQYESQINNYERQISHQSSQISSLNSTINSLNNQISSLRTSSSAQSTTNIPQANDTYDSSAINLLSRLSNNSSDKELILELDNYDAVLYYSHNQRRIILDIIEKGCRTSCTSQVRITSSQNNLYSLEWGSFNHPQGGYSLGKDAFDRALTMIR